jgi:hypothetical protein
MRQKVRSTWILLGAAFLWRLQLSGPSEFPFSILDRKNQAAWNAKTVNG